jgi:hypothetical protein
MSEFSIPDFDLLRSYGVDTSIVAEAFAIPETYTKPSPPVLTSPSANRRLHSQSNHDQVSSALLNLAKQVEQLSVKKKRKKVEKSISPQLVPPPSKNDASVKLSSIDSSDFHVSSKHSGRISPRFIRPLSLSNQSSSSQAILNSEPDHSRSIPQRPSTPPLSSLPVSFPQASSSSSSDLISQPIPEITTLLAIRPKSNMLTPSFVEARSRTPFFIETNTSSENSAHGDIKNIEQEQHLKSDSKDSIKVSEKFHDTKKISLKQTKSEKSKIERISEISQELGMFDEELCILDDDEIDQIPLPPQSPPTNSTNTNPMLGSSSHAINFQMLDKPPSPPPLSSVVQETHRKPLRKDALSIPPRNAMRVEKIEATDMFHDLESLSSFQNDATAPFSSWITSK